MSALVITLLRIGFLVLLWLFIIFVVITIKNDVFGTRITTTAPKNREQRRTPLRTQPSKPSTVHLVVTEGALSGTTIPLDTAAVTVGRSPDSTLVLDDGYASSRHARFFSEQGIWYIEDLNSTNGTWVAGQRIYQPFQLRPGIPVIIGKTTMELR